MANIKIGDVVGRKSYGMDVYFKVAKIYGKGPGAMAFLKGLDVRLCADAPLEDLERVSPEALRAFRQKVIRRNQRCLGEASSRREQVMADLYLYRTGEDHAPPFFEVPGSVLHLDGDEEYLEICLSTYKQLDVKAYGLCLPEAEMPHRVRELLEEYQPDILVLTGHDGLLKDRRDFHDLASYRNSPAFVQAVHMARHHETNLDNLIIIAGACQSHYEALIKAGANFASSPQRVLIHCLDPVLLSEKVAYTPIGQTLAIADALQATITGLSGVGGVETRGKYRLGFPKSPY
ncbi:MAG: sporulation peptidase YabG [Firmicutes bacterium]|nr:sporulation peptidase YabG [Bacillota bacterium]